MMILLPPPPLCITSRRSSHENGRRSCGLQTKKITSNLHLHQQGFQSCWLVTLEYDRSELYCVHVSVIKTVAGWLSPDLLFPSRRDASFSIGVGVIRHARTLCYCDCLPQWHSTSDEDILMLAGCGGLVGYIGVAVAACDGLWRRESRWVVSPHHRHPRRKTLPGLGVSVVSGTACLRRFTLQNPCIVIILV